MPKLKIHLQVIKVKINSCNLKNVYKDKVVLVTGHTGFKGSWLSIWLHQLGAKGYKVSDNVHNSFKLRGFKNR